MGCAFLYVLSFYLILKSAQSRTADCPDNYLRYSKDHSYCKERNPKCNIMATYLSKDDISKVLDLHNSFRSKIATKTETKADLPTAGNMLQMEWDNELAAVAQRYAEQCIYAHDTGDQRRVRNFGVGQNIAQQKSSGNSAQPQPDWSTAVTAWYNEITAFSSDKICNFQRPTNGKEYRHFTQVIWAKSFRIGCGYVMYKDGDTYYQNYICNYGPAGNTYGTCAYDKGAPCSKCPQNTCCGKKCGLDKPTYPGLCKRTNQQPPITPVQQPTLFNCDFQDVNKEDCRMSIAGPNKWYIVPALDGNFLETVLNGGENSTITFSKTVKPHSKGFCVQIIFRKGPNKDGTPVNNKANAMFIVPSMTFSPALPSYDGEYRQEFSSYNISLKWDSETQMKISFAVPANADPQFLNVESVLAVDDACGK